MIVVSVVAGEAGGLGGFVIGRRWGRRLLERPGRHRARREKVMERGESVYARWGFLAVFVTPAIVSGTAKMALGRFAFWRQQLDDRTGRDQRARPRRDEHAAR